MDGKPPARWALCLAAGVVLIAAGSQAASVDGAGARLEARPLKVAVVVDPPAGSRDPWGRMAVAGLREAVARLGIDREAARVLRPSPKEGYLPTLLYLGRRRYDLVIGVGYAQARAIDIAGRKFRQLRFVLVDEEYRALPHHPRNVAAVTFASEEAGYLAGYLAGLVVNRAPGRHAIGSVGGKKAPQIDRFIAGYQAGARRAAPGITTLNGYANGFFASQRARCRNVALRQIARGAGVVFNVAGACGLGALLAAKEKAVWGIGVDVDESSLGRYILTSAVKNVDAAIFETVRATQRGRLALGRTTVLGLRQRAVGLGRISSRVPRELVSRVDRVQRLIAAGRIRGIPTRLR